ncbi:MAG TPA: sphingomyelin phosphodiesterase, partial [Bacteroidia bacterium]|nr:sphingomyelin phosphodiesterase [Bacteroidia bacterium]
MKQRLLLLVCLFGLALGAHAQSSLFLRNNSWLDFDISIHQKGSFTADPIQYNHAVTLLDNWIEDTETFIAARDSSVLPMGDSVVYGIAISHGIDTIWVDFRLLRNGATTDFATRMHGSGFDTGYNADGSFHFGAVTIDGRDLILKYKADNDDTQQDRDIRLAIHETPIYEIDSADFTNPNVLNVMAYNIQFLPLGVVGLPQAADRADLLPAELSPYQDVVIFEEAFDPLPRLLNLEPAMQAAGFPYNSGILNDYLPFNGGVIIYSRWPIEATDEYDFELCGPNAQDCLANKGIKYAKINKLGKAYHVFGTHFDAGSDTPDLEAKNLQYTEMKNFIAAQNIPNHEAVIWGGDLNTDAVNSHNLYSNLRDSIDIVVPDYSGFFESTFSRDTGDVIDHVFTDPRYLLPLEGTVFITTFRSLSSVLWDLSEFSDHRCAISRFRFPDLSVSGGDQDLCPGEPMAFSSSANIPVQRSWYKNGNLIPGVNGPGIAIAATTLP